MSFDILQENILTLQNPTVVGLDPRPDFVPKHIIERHTADKGVRHSRRSRTLFIRITEA